MSKDPFFFYTDNFLNKEEILEIERKVMHSQPFYFFAGEKIGRDTSKDHGPGYVMGNDFSDYPFLVSGDNSKTPNSPIVEISRMILDKLNISKILPPLKITRSKSNLTSRTVERRLSWPHVDTYSKHFVVLYYVNSSDGDTVIYNQHYSGKVYDQSEPHITTGR